MSKYDEYKNNIEIEKDKYNIKNINYDFIYKEKIDYIKLNKYNDITSFSDLISSIQSGRRKNPLNNLSVQQLQALNQLNNGQLQHGQNQYNKLQTKLFKVPPQQKINQQQSLSPTAVTTGWSPTSNAGIIYKFNRGVIGIDREGNITERILDGTTVHHSEITAEVGNLTNLGSSEIYNKPFENGLLASEGGIIIIQLEGNSALVYLPAELTEEQLIALNSEITPRNFFSISFTHDGNIYEDDDINGQILMDFCSNLVHSLSR